MYSKSIKQRLVLIILLVASLTSLIGYSSFVYVSVLKEKERTIDLSQTISKVISQNITKLILLNDVNIASDIVSELKIFDSLKKMVLYNLEEKVILEYSNDKDVLNSNIIKLDELAMYKDRHLGYIKFYFNTKTIYDIFKENILLPIFIIVFMIVVTYLLANFFSKKFIEPILTLVDFLDGIELFGSLNKRVYTKEKNEYGKLYNEINLMLERIESSQKKINEKELMLIQQSKMAAMGEMIGNISHQWRQPLSVISALSTAMIIKKEISMNYSKGDEVNDLNKINDTTTYLSETIDDFKNFFSPNKEASIFDVKNSYIDTKNIISSKLSTNSIQIVENIQSYEVTNLENEFKHVIINIFNNAIDAIEGPSNNKIENKKFIFVDVFKEDKYVIIKIKDSAGGIKDDIINKVFEPYFTTKHQSQGTGIGLYMSYEMIVNHMNGFIEVENEKYVYENNNYEGACFTIGLPI